jgi:hypothetical protein
MYAPTQLCEFGRKIIITPSAKMSLPMFMTKIQKFEKRNCGVYTVFAYHWAYV